MGQQFGRAAESAAWQQNNLRCDPLAGMTYMALTQALVWDARPEEGLELIARGEALKIYIPFKRDMRQVALLAAGQFKQDAEAYMPAAHGTIYPFPDRLMLEARVGDQVRAREISDAYLARPGVDDWSSMVAAAVVGNRQGANAAAARIDGRPGGPFMLARRLADVLLRRTLRPGCNAQFQGAVRGVGFPLATAGSGRLPAQDLVIAQATRTLPLRALRVQVFVVTTVEVDDPVRC